MGTSSSSTRSSPAAARPRTIDEYLSTVGAGQRAALERLRRIVRAAAPRAQECIHYGLPAFRLDGPLVAFKAGANHCSFFLLSSTTLAAHEEDVEGYDTSAGTIRFQPDEPLPVALVRKLVKARLAENATSSGRYRRRGSPSR